MKLLTGLYAYSPERVCRTNKECRNSLELALHNLEHVLDFMGKLIHVALTLSNSSLPLDHVVVDRCCRDVGALTTGFAYENQRDVSA